MNRYFLSHDDNLPTMKEFGMMGELHFIDLASHGPNGDKWNIVVLKDDHVNPKPAWFPFPSVLDPKTTLNQSMIPASLLADLKLTGEETTMEMVYKFTGIMPPMGI